MGEGIDWELVGDSLVPLLMGLVQGTIPLTVITFVLGMALALVVALMRLSKSRMLSGVARAYVSVIRGTPLLVQLFIIFYGLPSLGLTIGTFPSAVIAFTRDSALVDDVDQALADLRADGTLAEISQQWFGADVTQ